MYCTKQDMIDRGWNDDLLGLTDLASVGVIDDLILNRAIEDACGEIDFYLSPRYTTPIANPSDTIVRYACDLTRIFLFDKQVPEQLQKRYGVITRTLELAAKGAIPFIVTAPDVTTGVAITENYAEMTASRASVFG